MINTMQNTIFIELILFGIAVIKAYGQPNFGAID